MITAFALLVTVHGLIHLLGVAKAFHLAELPQLTQPISPFFGALWLMSALLFVVTAVSLVVSPRWWWVLGACGVLVSMFVIVPSWPDAKVGAAANAIVFAGVAFGFLSQGPFSLRAEYERDVANGLAGLADAPPVTDADLAHLPAAVQRYLRAAGVVGQPRIRNFHVTMHGRIRAGSHDRWMPFTAEQYNFVEPYARFFYLNASMFAIPVQGYHRYAGPSASMRVKAAALVPVATASGMEMARSETVTLFNDLCLMAPATLIDPAIEWEAVDSRTVMARFTNRGRAIHADLSFDDAGMLTNFVSDDRYQSAPDGRSMRSLRWSTPITGYRAFGSTRLLCGGEARWHEPEGEYPYIELTLDDVQYNVTRGTASALHLPRRSLPSARSKR
jgi:Family of unknown function (DUF6544)